MTGRHVYILNRICRKQKYNLNQVHWFCWNYIKGISKDCLASVHDRLFYKKITNENKLIDIYFSSHRFYLQP